jgi:transforming growth factor-beta-induced protein
MKTLLSKRESGRIKRYHFLWLLLLFILPIACDDSGSNNDPDSIAEIVETDDNFSVLYDALSNAELVTTLDGDGPFTVFAPTNAAFSELQAGFVNDLTTPELTEVLTYHVLSGNIMAADLSAEQAVEALSGGNLYITAGTSVNINASATVTEADVEASNGVIHIIDKVLIPDSFLDIVGIVSKRYDLTTLVSAVSTAELVSTLQGQTSNGYTVFAPTDEAFANLGVDLSSLTITELVGILTYHVLPTTVLSGDITAGDVTTVNGATISISLNNGTVQLTDQAGNTYNVVEADLEGTNGVIHVIDGVLLPS